MSGLINAPTGLRYGIGLIFETGLGGDGVDNPYPNTVVLVGAGSLAVSATQHLAASVRFSGGGSLRATPS